MSISSKRTISVNLYRGLYLNATAQLFLMLRLYKGCSSKQASFLVMGV